jgi:diadenylate cyclase
MGLRSFYETGIALDAQISYDLLMNIFTFRSPLHDGAVIISDNRIKAACCYLPLTMNPSLSHTYGTRHRAAFGITEESDALAVVVSEERGVVSLVDGGEITENLTASSLEEELRRALRGGGEEPAPSTARKRTAREAEARPSDA